MKFFDYDGPLIRFLNRMADLMWLNILAMLCCIPIVTIGASFTALHYVALKIVRDEEGYITRGFFKSFRQNFFQSTVLWVILLMVFAALGMDYYLIVRQGMEVGSVHRSLIVALGVLILFTAVMVFPMQARFSNPIRVTIKNAFIVAVLQFPKTFLMLLLLAVPVVVCLLSWRLFPLVFLFGLSVPAVLSAMLYNKSFLRMEAQFMEANPQEETEDPDRIFRDGPEEPDGTIPEAQHDTAGRLG